MATGYLFAGHCFPSVSQADDAYFTQMPPQFASNGTTHYLYSYTLINDVWGYRIHQFNPNPSLVYSGPSSAIRRYPSCDTSTYDYDYASAAAMWTFAFTTVFVLWYLSKNLGMIINAVRRW